MSRLTDRAALTAYRAGWSLVRRLPERLAYAVFDLIADIAARRGGSGVARMRANYARVRPDLDAAGLDALVRAGMRSYLRYWCEAFRLPDLTEADLVARVRTVGDAPVRAHLGAGKPAVMFLGHMGNWDLAGAWSTTQLAPVTTVAERLKPEELYDEFLGFRERLGMRILPLTGGSDVFRELTKALRASAFVALLADRDLTAGGVEVDFCGHRARMAVGPAALAVTTGAALHPVSVHYERRATGRGYELVIVFHDRVEVPATGATREKVATMTQACADALTGAVREHTEDWHMMQRVFVEDLDPARTPVASAEGAA
ncbi:phosphatidylinositol mannoside acyltransferase [Oryzihumus leptocrescens]|uniref:KDO2-lipid IV(A) lauroyltransferase n=1 Tax=Oryzihumus leptocrescens TaxID=297536 RepID=A0A542ZJ67_9MICO|nr:phosphatidylinositol mannoside acyltransferase [Oryzihumus leptocrescens]TQL60397.1 KDO2-lipid IV(A) lauroyltransferase [Oryzihumus leptocrescens]